MLKERVLTAVIGVVIAVVVITIGGYLYGALLTIIALLGWKEYAQMLIGGHKEIAPLWGFASLFVVFIAMILQAYQFAIGCIILSMIILGLLYILTNRGYTLMSISNSTFGYFYILGGFGALVLIRENGLYAYTNTPFLQASAGQVILWFLLLCTWASDTCAYFTGMKWGRRKIVPSISPNKSLEGFIGGFIGTIIVGQLYGFFVGIPLVHAFFMSLLIAIISPFGDLFESKLKRQCAIKDSGVLLPGHGGVLDRFDSLIFGAPLVLVYLLLI